MDVDQFRVRAEADQILTAYLETLHEEAAPLVPDRTANNDRFLLLLGLAATLALYEWLRAGTPLNAAGLQARLVPGLPWLAGQGFSRQEAEDAIAAVSTGLTVRPPDAETVAAGQVILRGEINP